MTDAPHALQIDGLTAPIGLGNSAPEFSWRLTCIEGQSAAEIVVEQLDTSTAMTEVWRARIESSKPYGHRYAGAPLESCGRYRWRVRVEQEGHSEPTPWSEHATFEMGLQHAHEWKARWISGAAPRSKKDDRALYLRGLVDLPAPVVRARAYASGLGWYRLLVNGDDVSGPALVPAWTQFDDVVEYQAYDVTAALKQGTNVIAMVLGDGRFRGRNGASSTRAIYGDRLAGLVQLHVELADGTEHCFITDEQWSAGAGRIVSSDPKFGEVVDLRIDDRAWLTSPKPHSGETAAVVVSSDRTLIAEETARFQQVGTLAPVAITTTPSGKQLIDFGQNFTGVVRIRLTGEAGQVVRLTHSEVAKPNGEIDTDYIQIFFLGRWYQRDVVTLGGGEQWFQPWFTFHGFRYVEVEGLDRALAPDDVQGIVLSSALDEASGFSCSDPRLDRLFQNVRWSLISNFLDTPTDCPTRERSGWTGDAQVFAPTAASIVDARTYFGRYLDNLAREQRPDGRIPVFIPSEASEFSGGVDASSTRITWSSVGWGDAVVLLPWTLHRYYDDTAALERLYPAMTRWVDYLDGRAASRSSRRRRGRRGTGDAALERSILDTGFNFGEWLRPDENFVRSAIDSVRRSGPVVATAYLEHSARTLGRIAAIIGRQGDAQKYSSIADRVRHAWRTAFIHPDARIGMDRQDDYVRAVAFGLLDDAEVPGAIDRLVALIEEAGGHLGTGFLSTPMLLPVLVDHRRLDVALRVLLQTSSPSWLHQVERGATTIWETWEGHTKRGTATMSHNHYALGSVAGFLVERIAGLAPGEPGYSVLDVQPLVDCGLQHARAGVLTRWGAAEVSWRHEAEHVVVDLLVPAGTRAHVRVRSLDVEVGGGQHTWRVGADPEGKLGA